MNDKFNKNAKVEKFTNLVGKAVRLIVIYPLHSHLNSSKEKISLTNNFRPLGLTTFSKTLTLAITTLLEGVGYLYFTCAALLFICSGLDLEVWLTFLKLKPPPYFCCYIRIVAAGELCRLSDNSGLFKCRIVHLWNLKIFAWCNMQWLLLLHCITICNATS